MNNDNEYFLNSLYDEVNERDKKYKNIAACVEQLNRELSKILVKQNESREIIAEVLNENAITLDERISLYVNDHLISYGNVHYQRKRDFLNELGFSSDGAFTETGQTALTFGVCYSTKEKLHNSILAVLPHVKKLNKGTFPGCYVFGIIEPTLSQWHVYNFVVNEINDSKYNFRFMKDNECLIESTDIDVVLDFICENHSYQK